MYIVYSRNLVALFYINGEIAISAVQTHFNPELRLLLAWNIYSCSYIVRVLTPDEC